MVLARLSCRPMRGEAALSVGEIEQHLTALQGWSVEGAALHKRFLFDDYAQVLLFSNAVGWMAIQQDHHPEMQIDSSTCTVLWSTHDVGGLSINDFICAARTDALR